MVADIVATSVAFVLLSLFIFAPGYVFGWFLNLLGFRERSLLARSAIAVPVSVAVMPELTYLLWHWSIAVVWVMHMGCWAGMLFLFFHERHKLSWPTINKTRATVLAIIAGWVVLGTLCLVDLQRGDRLYEPTVANDYMLRTAITSSLARTGVPPANPYFFPGHPVTLRYHYFWMMSSALVTRLGGTAISPRHAVIAGTLWSGIGLIALVALYLRFFQPKGPLNIDRRMLAGIRLLSVAGLDILPVVVFGTLSDIIPSIDFWNNLIATWISSVWWAPHHVAGLIACLTGVLVIWNTAGREGASNRMVGGIVAGLAFASSVGLSIYLTFVFAVFLGAWLAVASQQRQRNQILVILIAGLVALSFACPYLMELRRAAFFPDNPDKADGIPVQLTIRTFSTVDALLGLRGWKATLVNALTLPINYFLELGIFFVVGIMQWARMCRSQDFFRHRELCGFTMAAASVLICTFLRSSVIANNDLGWRGFMVAQFMLLIWAAEFWDEGVLLNDHKVARVRRSLISPADRRTLMAAMIVLGVAGSLYEVVMTRFYFVILDNSKKAAYFLRTSEQIGRRTYALRQVYEELKRTLPERTIVRHNPNAA